MWCCRRCWLTIQDISACVVLHEEEEDYIVAPFHDGCSVICMPITSPAVVCASASMQHPRSKHTVAWTAIR